MSTINFSYKKKTRRRRR